ncbi:MAG: alpha/beta fold hydrolase [Solirubrobacterales bacterium]
MLDLVRTPDHRFDALPDFDYEPSYVTAGDLRLAHLDVGDGPPVVMLHGEPAWSFIWRKLIPPVRDAGFRCVVPDHAGFGRSDKPVDPAWHSLDRHIALTHRVLEELDLREATLVVHDWGGPIGLTLALAAPERIARLVLLDTAIDFREVWRSQTWVRFREFVERTEDLPVAEVMRATCARDPGHDVLAAYEAPFPTAQSKAAMRGLPMSIPGAKDAAAATEAEQFYDALRSDRRPMLILWGGSDVVLTLASGQRLASRIGRDVDHVIPHAGHGLQEDEGPMIGSLIADWLVAESG